jgi:ArsR family transcriptional regulator, arsenate/arsenite/antimonite-responsive transcriptional repressor
MSACADESFDEVSAKLKAIGHPIRLKLLCMIEKQEEPCVTSLWTCLNQPQPVVSQHLAVLKEHGIVKAEVHGTKRVYSIEDPFVREIVVAVIKDNFKDGAKGR